MKKTALLSLLTAAMLPLAASGQEQAQPLTSADATALFRRIDVNQDQQVTQAEARPHGLTAALLKAHDHSGDGKFSESEFLLAFKAMAEANGSTVSRDLAKQATRIQAAQRAAAKEAAELKAQRAKYNRRLDAAKDKQSANERAQAKRRQDAVETARKEAKRAAQKQAEAKRKRAGQISPGNRPEAQRPSRRKP
ncbi:MAG: hypothetical protein ACI9D0_000347 [Bacteroidia bacterium]|jgi:hypothetical protein